MTDKCPIPILKKHETDALWNNGVKEKVPENAMLSIAVLPDLIV
jgi:hypothetical protein